MPLRLSAGSSGLSGVRGSKGRTEESGLMTDSAEADQTPLGEVMQSAWSLSRATAEPDEEVAALFEHAASVILPATRCGRGDRPSV